MAAIAACAASATPLHAAEIKASFEFNVVIEGNIETGDYEKLRKFIEKDDNIDSIYLASPGGDVAEAIKIGRLVRALNLETVIHGQVANEVRSKSSEGLLNTMADRNNIKNISANYMCTSACFFVFVAGVHRIKAPQIFDEPVLGVHRPFLTDNDLRVLSANEAITSAKRFRTFIESYLKEMDVPAKYADLMFSVPKEKVLWIGSSDFESDLEGFIPELKDWMDARCDKRTDVEKAIWEDLKGKSKAQMTSTEKAVSDLLVKKALEQYKCESEALSELSHQAHLKVFPDQR